VGLQGKIGLWYEPLTIWRQILRGRRDGRGRADRHYLAEEAPQAVLERFEVFLFGLGARIAAFAAQRHCAEAAASCTETAMRWPGGQAPSQWQTAIPGARLAAMTTQQCALLWLLALTACTLVGCTDMVDGEPGAHALPDSHPGASILIPPPDIEILRHHATRHPRRGARRLFVAARGGRSRPATAIPRAAGLRPGAIPLSSAT
jgi:hypothetical protein